MTYVVRMFNDAVLSAEGGLVSFHNFVSRHLYLDVTSLHTCIVYLKPINEPLDVVN
jgi:hypothetical protein